MFFKKNKEDKMIDYELLMTSPNDINACIIEGLLNSNGIECKLKYDADIEWMRVYIGRSLCSVNIYVKKDKIDEAKKLLNDMEQEDEGSTYEENLKVFINYFKDGIEKEKNNNLGFELEHIIVDENNNSISYYGDNGIEKMLEVLSEEYDEKVFSLKGRIIGLNRKNVAITLEPAAQFEVSMGPFDNIKKIKEEYEKFLTPVLKYLNKFNYQISYTGYHPKSKIDDLKLIPKNRYEYMLDYFKNVGEYGKNMMKGSASAQVSIDYYSEEDFIKKFRLANILSPAFSLLTDNTAVFEGEVYDKYMMRTVIWNDTDKDRSMIVKDSLNKKFGFLEYAKYILNSPAILTMENNKATYTKEKPIKDIYKDKIITKEEAEHLLSMFFPDVRLKKYIEIRMADAMPLKYCLGYIALIKGIFYNEDNLNYFLKKTEFVTDEIAAKTKLDLIENGYEADIYKEKADEFIINLLDKAKDALDEEEKEYINPLINLAKNKTTLAKENIKAFKTNDKKNLI